MSCIWVPYVDRTIVSCRLCTGKRPTQVRPTSSRSPAAPLCWNCDTTPWCIKGSEKPEKFVLAWNLEPYLLCVWRDNNKTFFHEYVRVEVDYVLCPEALNRKTDVLTAQTGSLASVNAISLPQITQFIALQVSAYDLSPAPIISWSFEVFKLWVRHKNVLAVLVKFNLSTITRHTDQ